MPDLNDENQARLESCMDEIRNVVGDMTSQRQLVETIMAYDYDCNKALDAILNQSKPTANPTVIVPPKELMETGISLDALHRSNIFLLNFLLFFSLYHISCAVNDCIPVYLSIYYAR